MNVRVGVLVLAALVSSCGDAERAWPDDCAGLTPMERVACGEARFWAVHTTDYEARESVYAMLGEILAEAPEGVDDEALASLHFRRGALALELALEHGRGDLVEEITPAFHEAARLDPANAKVGPWIDSMELVTHFARGDREAFDAVVARLEENVARYPTGNILSITGTMSGFPRATGLPDRAVEMLESWGCDERWCMRNTERAPFSQPGLEVHFADAYARIGDVERAGFHFERALAAEGADAWPHRAMVEEALADLDAYVARYDELGDDGSAITLVYANGSNGCRICHGTR